MKKKFIAIASAAVLTLSMSVSAFAAPFSGYYGDRYYPSGHCVMWDVDGNFFDKESYEANLDKALEEGLITLEDKEYLLGWYDYSTSYRGGFGGCCGCGRGMRY